MTLYIAVYITHARCVHANEVSEGGRLHSSGSICVTMRVAYITSLSLLVDSFPLEALTTSFHPHPPSSLLLPSMTHFTQRERVCRVYCAQQPYYGGSFTDRSVQFKLSSETVCGGVEYLNGTTRDASMERSFVSRLRLCFNAYFRARHWCTCSLIHAMIKRH